MKEASIKFEKAKDTKNTVKYDEKPEAGAPAVIGTLYVQKWFAGDAKVVTVNLQIED